MQHCPKALGLEGSLWFPRVFFTLDVPEQSELGASRGVRALSPPAAGV